jgi:hypothetical protein
VYRTEFFFGFMKHWTLWNFIFGRENLTAERWGFIVVRRKTTS